MKKWAIIMTVFCLTVSLTGCDAVQRKFTRKKKTAVKMPRFYQVKKYPKKPAPELYKKHYSYWRTWQGELIDNIGQNNKKARRCAEEAVGQLRDLQGLLIPSKAEEMERHIVSMEGVRDIIARGDITFATKDSVRQTAEREDRIIGKDFCFAKVKNYLIKVTNDEEPIPKLSMVKGAEGAIEQQK